MTGSLEGATDDLLHESDFDQQTQEEIVETKKKKKKKRKKNFQQAISERS